MIVLFFRYCLKCFYLKYLEKYSNHCFFVGGSPKRKFNHDDTHDHGQGKRRPSTYVEGKNGNTFNGAGGVMGGSGWLVVAGGRW